MANVTLNIVYVGEELNVLMLESVIKNFLGPRQFHIEPVLSRALGDMLPTREKLEKLRSEGWMPGISAEFVQLHLLTLAALDQHPSAHLAISHNRAQTYIGFDSEYMSAQALVLDAMRDGKPLEYRRTHGEVAKSIARYLGPTQAGAVQSKRKLKTVLQDAFEGWVDWSVAKNGMIKRLRRA